MKYSNFCFLALILVAAIVLGSTLSIAGNFKVITQAVKNSSATNVQGTSSAKISTVQGNTRLQTANNQSVQTAATDNVQTTASAKSSSVQTAATSSGATSSELMVVSPEEKAAITSMLVELGMPSGSDSSQFIKQFQQMHGIKPTGNMDSLTLNRIIDAVTYQRASQLAGD